MVSGTFSWGRTLPRRAKRASAQERGQVHFRKNGTTPLQPASRSSGRLARHRRLPMKQSLGLVSLVVRDYDEAIGFFVDRRTGGQSRLPKPARRKLYSDPGSDPGSAVTAPRT